MNRPDWYNAADEQMHRELARLWADVSADPKTRVPLITGAGKAFSAGGAGTVVALLADISICALDARIGDGHFKLGDHAAICGRCCAAFYDCPCERIRLLSASVTRTGDS